MARNNCPLVTDEHRELAKYFPGETPKSIANFVGMWQEGNQVSEDTMPTRKQLKEYIEFERNDNVKKLDNSLARNPGERNNYKPNRLGTIYSSETRKLRVGYIAQMFSGLVEETMKDLDGKITRREVLSGYEAIYDEIKDNLDYYSKPEAWLKDEDFIDRFGSNKKTLSKEAKHYATEYKKMYDNFDLFRPEVEQLLAVSEGVMFKGNVPSFNEIDLDVDENGESYSEDEAESHTKEEEPKEHWQEDVRFLDPRKSLSRDVRQLLSTILDLDKNGKERVDDIGNPIYLDSNKAHAVLIKELDNMTLSRHLIPMLTKLEQKYPWVKGIKEILSDPEEQALKSQFYTNFRKDFQELWMMSATVAENGKVSYKLFPINRNTAATAIIEEWKNNIESRVTADKNTIYDAKGFTVKAKSTAARKLIEKLTAQLHNKSAEFKTEILEDAKFFSDLIDAVNRAGITANPAEIKNALLVNQQNLGEDFEVNSVTPLDQLLDDLGMIFQGTEKRPVSTDELVPKYNGLYASIARTIRPGEISEIVSAVREGGKTRYSHIVPSYLGKLIKNLKGVHGDAEFQEFLEEEYGQYEWFKKDGNWMNPWLEHLASSKTAREKLMYHTLAMAQINGRKKEYVDWTPLEYMQIMINEYLTDGDRPNKGDSTYAYYHLPILSDSQSAEFIHGRRYTNNTGGRDANGNNRTYQDQILDHMVKIVMQEFNRIATVIEREGLIHDKSVKAITNYDIVRKKDGTINYKKSRGLAFNFLPALNDLRFGEDGIHFIDRLEELLNENNPNVNQFIRDAVTQVTEAGFNRNLEYWREIGLLDKLENGEHKYIEAEDLLHEYYWNSRLATASIIQLTTTDLAFYKDPIDDFQKRFKEIEGKTNKLDTSVGSPYERTVYLKDEANFVSSALLDLEHVLDIRVKEGTLHVLDKEHILSKFGKYVDQGKKGINVTDAQAYRSLKSYKDIKEKLGQWNDAEKRAFANFEANKWDMNDFYTLFQPIKPFVYTQTKVRSGINGKSIKVPVQHKNAEYLLLAAYELIAGPLYQSSKLKALNDFMLDREIDVVQFESAVKVGLQGAIDVNAVPNTYRDIYNHLNNSVFKNGEFDPDVVHTIDYNDYGIQVELPQHTLDTQILDGTQLRALIISDLPDDYEFTIGNNKYTKAELIRLYHSLIVENVSVSAQNVDEIFNNPIRLNEELQKEMRGNPRYGIGLLEAIKMVDGKPLLPYYEIGQGNKLEASMNAIAKNQIIRQKSKGGAYIQVSNWGLTDKLNVIYEGEGDDRHVAYWEVYMPYWSKQFLPDKYFNKLTNELEIDRIPPKMLDALGFRIPTENKYSMPPLKIVGFLPQSSGDAIMLPADITTSMGSDFDVDKLYVYLYEFDKNGQKIEYDYSKSPEDQSLAARNNAILDIRMAIMKSPVAAQLAAIPGNYDAQKHAAAVVSLAQNMSEGELRKMLNLKPGQNMLTELRSIDVETIEDLAKSVRDKLDPLDPMTQLKLHERNMTGAKMIGIIANHKKHHALMQFTDLQVAEDYIPTLNGKRYSALNQVLTPDKKKYISEPIAGFLAASVDNGKDPVLGFITFNSLTANVGMFLSRLGYSPLEISLFLSQPAIVEISRNYNNGERDAIDKYIAEKLKGLNIKKTELDEMIEQNKFLVNDLFDNILSRGERNNPMFDLMTAVQFSNFSKPANDLNRLTRVKVDNQNGGMGPQVSNTIINKKRIDKLHQDIEEGNFTLIGADYLKDGFSDMADMKNEVMKTRIPYIQMFYSAGIESAKRRIQPYTFKYTESMDNMINKLSDGMAAAELNPVLLNKFFNEFSVYKATAFGFFGADESMNAAEKRENMMKTFPGYFEEVVSKNPSIANLPFIGKIKPIPRKGVPFKTLEFMNVNHLSQNQKDNYGNDWDFLLYNKDESARRLGIGLWLYAMYRGGWGFGPSNYANIATPSVKLAVPEYLEVMESLDNEESKLSESSFVEQFVRNHLDDRNIVHYLPKESDVEYKPELVLSEKTARQLGLIKEQIEDSLSLRNYIALPLAQGYAYYKLDGIYSNDMITFTEIKPLGIKNILLEYEYEVIPDAVVSIVEKNTVQPTNEDAQNDENDDIVDPNIEDPHVSREYNRPTMYQEDLGDLALKATFGATRIPGDENIPDRKRTINDFEANKDWTDVTGNKLC